MSDRYRVYPIDMIPKGDGTFFDMSAAKQDRGYVLERVLNLLDGVEVEGRFLHSVSDVVSIEGVVAVFARPS